MHYLCIPLHFLSQTKYGTFNSVAIVCRSISYHCIKKYNYISPV